MVYTLAVGVTGVEVQCKLMGELPVWRNLGSEAKSREEFITEEETRGGQKDQGVSIVFKFEGFSVLYLGCNV